MHSKYNTTAPVDQYFSAMGKPGLVADFILGQIVYLRLKTEKSPGFVTAINFRGTGITYAVTWADTRAETWHFPFELTDDYQLSYD